jgi:hypothetical protein
MEIAITGTTSNYPQEEIKERGSSYLRGKDENVRETKVWQFAAVASLRLKIEMLVFVSGLHDLTI